MIRIDGVAEIRHLGKCAGGQMPLRLVVHLKLSMRRLYSNYRKKLYLHFQKMDYNSFKTSLTEVVSFLSRTTVWEGGCLFLSKSTLF